MLLGLSGQTPLRTRVCRLCGPVGQVGEGMCPKALSGSQAARCNRFGAERRGEAPLRAVMVSHCGASRSWPRIEMTALRAGPPSVLGSAREAGRVGRPAPGRPASPRTLQGWGVAANSTCLPPDHRLPASRCFAPGARLPASSQWLKCGDRNVILCCRFCVCLKFP